MYSSESNLKRYKTSFDLVAASSKPDLRNALYVDYPVHLTCPVCRQPFIRPMTTICGHTFCFECIAECIDLTEHCPLDRTPLMKDNVNDIFPTPLIVANMVDELQVTCLNHERGCEWIGQRWLLEHHVTSECGYTGVHCRGLQLDEAAEAPELPRAASATLSGGGGGATLAPSGIEDVGALDSPPPRISSDHTPQPDQLNTTSRLETLDSPRPHRFGLPDSTPEPYEPYGVDTEFDPLTEAFDAAYLHSHKECPLLVERRFLDGDECVHKLYPCPKCSSQITKATKEDHELHECEGNLQRCELCGNDAIPQKNMAKHQANCKRSGRIRCPAHHIGCKWVGDTEPTLEAHTEKCPLHSLVPFVESLQDKIGALENANRALQQLLGKILDSIVQGKVTNLGYSEPVEEIGRFSQDLSEAHSRDCMVHLEWEIDRLRAEMDRKVNPFISRELQALTERQNTMNGLLSDNFIMKDELSVQRRMISGLRKQMQFLLVRNRPYVETPELPRSTSEERLNLKL